jgi:TolB protein
MRTYTLPIRTPGLGIIVAAALLAGTGLRGAAAPAQQPPPAQPQGQQPAEFEVVIGGDSGAPPRFAVPDFVALTPDVAEAAKTIGQVLWDDLNFEREFYLIPRDTYASIPQARTADQIAFASWRELGADGVLFGTVQRTGDKVIVQVRLLNIRSRQPVFSKEYSGTVSNPRLYAHTIADEIHLQQRALKGVARTKLAFASDRTRDRVSGAVPNREVKEIYVSDYDGGNQQRITNTRQLNNFPSWSPDARAVAYTSFRRIVPDIFISRIYQGILDNPLKGQGANYLPVYSPDGSRIAFMSNRDGNPEIYVMNSDGSNVRRLTNHPAGDSTPTWSPTGTQIAFTSDRAGQPQIYLMSSADGTGLRKLTSESYADRATWAPAGLNELAFTARNQGGYDIKVMDMSTGNIRVITAGVNGSNESPTFSPSGRHLAFTSTRGGRTHVFIIGRDGRGLRQVTTDGNNFSPAWSK